MTESKTAVFLAHKDFASDKKKKLNKVLLILLQEAKDSLLKRAQGERQKREVSNIITKFSMI